MLQSRPGSLIRFDPLLPLSFASELVSQVIEERLPLKFVQRASNAASGFENVLPTQYPHPKRVQRISSNLFAAGYTYQEKLSLKVLRCHVCKRDREQASRFQSLLKKPGDPPL
jgi:hypothetical protein